MASEKFRHLEQMDKENLRAEIIGMSLFNKEELLEETLINDDVPENNLRVAIVIQQYIIEDLKGLLQSV